MAVQSIGVTAPTYTRFDSLSLRIITDEHINSLFLAGNVRLILSFNQKKDDDGQN